MTVPVPKRATTAPTPSTLPSQSFPMLVLAALIVAAGIYMVDDMMSPRAAWLIAFLVLLTIAFRYKHFGDQITGLFGGVTAKQETSPLITSMPIVVGPLGPI